MRLLASLCIVAWRIALVCANNEKAVFLAPQALHHQPSVEQLRLPVLTPAHWTIRTDLAASFPSPQKPQGTAAWILLDQLCPNQRHEIRICWSATVNCTFRSELFLFRLLFALYTKTIALVLLLSLCVF